MGLIEHQTYVHINVKMCQQILGSEGRAMKTNCDFRPHRRDGGFNFCTKVEKGSIKGGPLEGISDAENRCCFYCILDKRDCEKCSTITPYSGTK